MLIAVPLVITMAVGLILGLRLRQRGQREPEALGPGHRGRDSHAGRHRDGQRHGQPDDHGQRDRERDGDGHPGGSGQRPT